MQFAFTPDQLALRDGLREALRGACPPAVVRQAWEAPQDELARAVADLGVLGVLAPERVGGLGLGMVEAVVLLEEIGRAAVPGPIAEAVAVVPTLVELGRDDLAGRVIRGEAVVAVMVEGGFAQDADRAELVIGVDGDAVSAVVDPALVAQPSVDGSRRLFRVDGRRERVAASGDALFDRAALGVAAELVGLGRRALELAVAYAKERHQFGRPIGSFQAVQHRLVDAHLRLEFAAPLVHRAAFSMSTGDPETRVHVALAKAYASEAADLACRASLQVHGAIGYTTEYDLHLWLKRVLARRASWGDVARHRDRIASELWRTRA